MTNMKINPNRIFTVSSKRLYDKCPRAWAYRNVLGWEPKELPDPLIRGTELHEGAEGTYSGDTDKIQTAKQTAYDRWAKKYDDLAVNHVEKAFVIPATAMFELAYGEKPIVQHLAGDYYGGVIDLVASTKDHSWVVDHKSVLSFYPTAEPYMLEQITMYCVAWEILTGESLEGGVISRVKQLETNPIHTLNYTLKELKKHDIDLTKTQISGIIQYCTKHYTTLHKHITHTKDTKHTVYVCKDTKDTTHTKHTVTLSLKPKGLRVGVTVRDTQGRMIESIQTLHGSLVHVKRQYYAISLTQKQSVIRDFLSFVYEMRRADQRRSPGMHCRQCPYLLECLEEQRRGLMLGDSLPSDQQKFDVVPPNKELLQRIDIT